MVRKDENRSFGSDPRHEIHRNCGCESGAFCNAREWMAALEYPLELKDGFWQFCSGAEEA